MKQLFKNLITAVIVGLFIAGTVSAVLLGNFQGGTGKDSSAWTGCVQTTAGVWSTTTCGVAETDPIWIASSTSYLATTTAASTYVARATWTTHDNYPSNCAANSFVTGLGDILNCNKVTPAGLNNEDFGDWTCNGTTCSIDSGLNLTFGNTTSTNLVVTGNTTLNTAWTGVLRVDSGVVSTTTSGGTGTVTSVAMSVPTGLSISGSPITTSGTLGLTLTAGYNIPLTASTTNWNTAYGWGDHTSAGYLTAAITSLNGLTGATQTFASSSVGTDFYITSSGTAHTFNLPTASGSIRGLLSSTDWTTFNNKLSSAITSLGGQTGATQTFATSSDTNIGLTITSSGNIHTFTSNWIGTLADGRIASAATWNAKQNALSFPLAYASTTHITATSPLTITSGVISIPTSTASVSGYLSSADWTIFNNKGSGTVTSVAMTTPTGLTIGGSPITTSGTLALTLTSGYIIPLSASTTEFATAYSERRQWDGGSTNLVAATGRTSLELGTMSLLANTGSTTITTLGTIATGVWSGTSILDAKIASSTNYLADTKWTGISTDLVAATGRTSLELGTMSLLANTGSTTITTLGTIATGVWSGTSILNAKIASSTEYLVDNNTTYTGTNPITLTGTVFSLSATTSAAWASLITDEEGTGKIVFNTSPTFLTGITVPNDSISSSELSEGDAFVFTGSVALPQGAPTIDSAGEIGVDTTSDQLVYYGTAKRTLINYQSPSFTIASTTWSTTGTTTIPIGFALVAETWTSIGCFTNTATTTINFGDGTNWMADYTASTTPSLMTVSSNNTFTALERRYIRISRFTGTPNYLTCTIKKVIDAD